jgi:tetratricopeptide (TPR) repeat protein
MTMNGRNGLIGAAFLAALSACALAPPAYAFSGQGCYMDPALNRSMSAMILALQISIGDGSANSEDRTCMLYGLGTLHQFEGKYDLAIADYTHAIGWMRDFPDAYFARGDAYEALGQHDKALADYYAAQAGGRDEVWGIADRCWVRAVRGFPLDAALIDCNEAVRELPSAWSFLDERCFVHYRMGDYADAIADCNAALKIKDRLAPALYIGGLAKVHSGDVAGGNADIAAAKSVDYRIADAFAQFGVTQ